MRRRNRFLVLKNPPINSTDPVERDILTWPADGRSLFTVTTIAMRTKAKRGRVQRVVMRFLKSGLIAEVRAHKWTC